MDCINFYSQFITDPNLLAHGHTIIRDYLIQSATNRSNTLANLLHPSVPVITLVGNVYPVDVYPTLGQQQKSMTRPFLMEFLLNTINKQGVKSKNSESLLQILRKIHNVEGYSSWVGLYAKLIQNLKPQHFGGLIIKILERADSRISDLSSNIFVYVIQTNHKYNLSVEKVFQILFYCVKSFAYMCGTDEERLNQFYKPYQQQFVDFIWTNLRTSPGCLKFGFKLLGVLYSQMNYALVQNESSKANITKLTSLGLQVCQQYIKIIAKPQYNKRYDTEQYEQLKQQLAENQSSNLIQDSINVIVFQLLELYQILLNQNEDEDLEHEGHDLNTYHILVCAMLGSVLGQNQMQHWIKNSSQYIVEIENEHQINLRNKCNQLMYLLLDAHEDKANHISFMITYFQTIAICIKNNDHNSALLHLSNFINSKLNPQSVQLVGEFANYEQSAYFILSSAMTMLFEGKQKQQLLYFLMERALTVQNVAIKIQTILQVVAEMKQPPQHDLISFFLNAIKKYESNQQLQIRPSFDDIGVALALGRGLGKICSSHYVQINKQIPSRYIQVLFNYLANVSADRVLEEDGSHIALQFIVRLTNCNKFKTGAQNPGVNQNQQLMSTLFSAQFQQVMLTHYMNDIYLSSMIVQLLNLYPLQHTITGLVHLLLGGFIHNQKYVQLIVKWVESGHVQFHNQHIFTILTAYPSARRQVIQPIIKLYLKMLVKNKDVPNSQQCTPQIVNILNSNLDQSWLVPMLQCGILEDPVAVLAKCVLKITYQITSQYELQTKMIMPFYIGLYNTQQFIQILQSQPSQPNLYMQFLQKLYKYALLFQGPHLKIISSLFWIKLSQVDRSLIKNTIQMVEGYGSSNLSEWEDLVQAQKSDQEDIIDRLMGGKIQNEEVEKDLQQIFQDLSWNSELVGSKLAELKQIQ